MIRLEELTDLVNKLLIPDVSKRSELLRFYRFLHKDEQIQETWMLEDIDKFLKQ